MLQAKDISYEIETADGPLTLLNHVNFIVPDGHFMAIVGSSGCGKTTLLKAIAGMIEETDGVFLWNGVDLVERDFEPCEIGFVPQFSIAYEQLTVDENIESAARLRCRFDTGEQLDACIDRSLALTGMEPIAERDVKILSGGQKRRLALAMELVSNPKLLLCDEVTSGLDPRSEHDIVKLLHEISRKDGRSVISVTHSLAHLEKYDSILVMHQGNVVYQGPPKTILHYFGVNSPEDIYLKLQERKGEEWARSWAKYRDQYYQRLQRDREQKIADGELSVRVTQTAPQGREGGMSPLPTEETATKKTQVASETMPEFPTMPGYEHAARQGEDRSVKEEGEEGKANLPEGMPAFDEREERQVRQGNEPAAGVEEEDLQELPGAVSQFFCLLGRRWKIFFRDKTQFVLQLVMILLFPILVALFVDKGSGNIINYSNAKTIETLQQDLEAKETNMKIGSAVSGIIMFEVILLGLMGSNNAAREIAGERAIMEKEKYAGMSPAAYLASKVVYLAILVCVQSLWMYYFVDLFWGRSGGLTHLLFLLLANAAITSVCLAISSLSKSADQASLLSIYLVGFQLPLSGAVLALPAAIEMLVRPFIASYWAWAGSISALSGDLMQTVKSALETNIAASDVCYYVLGAHVLLGIVIAYAGIQRSRWD